MTRIDWQTAILTALTLAALLLLEVIK